MSESESNVDNRLLRKKGMDVTYPADIFGVPDSIEKIVHLIDVIIKNIGVFVEKTKTFRPEDAKAIQGDLHTLVGLAQRFSTINKNVYAIMDGGDRSFYKEAYDLASEFMRVSIPFIGGLQTKYRNMTSAHFKELLEDRISVQNKPVDEKDPLHAMNDRCERVIEIITADQNRLKDPEMRIIIGEIIAISRVYMEDVSIEQTPSQDRSSSRSQLLQKLTALSELLEQARDTETSEALEVLLSPSHTDSAISQTASEILTLLDTKEGTTPGAE